MTKTPHVSFINITPITSHRPLVNRRRHYPGISVAWGGGEGRAETHLSNGSLSEKDEFDTAARFGSSRGG